MGDVLGAILKALLEGVFDELFKLGDMPDSISPTPPPVLDSIDPGGIVDSDLVRRYHRL